MDVLQQLLDLLFLGGAAVRGHPKQAARERPCQEVRRLNGRAGAAQD